MITPGFLPVPAFKGGAVEVLIEELIRANEIENKVDIDLYTIYDDGLKKVKFNNCNIIPVKVNWFNKLFSKVYNTFHKIVGEKGDIICPFGNSVNQLMKNKKYDYVIVQNNMKVFNSIKSKQNLIFHLHNDILDSDRTKYLCKKVIDESICILNVSKYLANRMRSIKDSEKIKVLYNCVDFEIFDKNNVTIDTICEMRKKYDFRQENFIFMYTGRIAEEKGVLELIYAFKKLRKDYKNIKLIVVGQGWFGKNIMSDFERKLHNITKDMQNDIIFTGFVEHNEIPPILALADCIIIPSKWEEPFGVVALEAMAMAKPIIATKSGGLTEPIDNSCAIIIEKDEKMVDDLYKAMEKMYLNPELRKEYRENGYNRCHSIKEFDKDNYFDNFLRKSEIE